MFLLCTLNLCKYDLPRGCRTLPGGIHRKPSYKQSKPLLAVYTSVEGDIHPHPGKSKEREKLTGIAYIQSLKNTPLKYMSKANDLYDTYLLTYLTHISVIENMNPLCHKHKYLQGKGSNKISEGNQMHRQSIQRSLDTAIASKPPHGNSRSRLKCLLRKSQVYQMASLLIFYFCTSFGEVIDHKIKVYIFSFPLPQDCSLKVIPLEYYLRYKTQVVRVCVCVRGCACACGHIPHSPK